MRRRSSSPSSAPREARYIPDGAGTFEVRLKFHYTDFREREDVKTLGFRWDPAAKEWYKSGLQQDEAQATGAVWAAHFADLDAGKVASSAPAAASLGAGPGRADRNAYRFDGVPWEDAARQAEALCRDLQRELDKLRAADLARQAAEAGKAGTYHATCPTCGGDCFFTVKEVERV